MSVFQTLYWDSNATSEELCQNFFQAGEPHKKKPNKKKNKVVKSTIDEKRESVKKVGVKSKVKKRKKLLKLPENVNENVISVATGNKDLKSKSKKKSTKKKSKKAVVENALEETKKHKENVSENNENLSHENSNEIGDSQTTIEIKHNNKRGLKAKMERLKDSSSLRERMLSRLKAARFRYINEQIYTINSKEAQKLFQDDPEAFKAYHAGYQQQVNVWPVNPLDVIIKNVQKLPKDYIIADFGCGEAKLAKTIQHKVYSFDLVAVNDLVTACDMANVPLDNNSVDVVVFCLSLMGTNLHDYLLEANRVLKVGGILKIAEIESRFENINDFIEAVKRFHFKNIWKDLNQDLFYFLDFKKESNIKNKKNLPTVSLNPCLYKKR